MKRERVKIKDYGEKYRAQKLRRKITRSRWKINGEDSTQWRNKKHEFFFSKKKLKGEKKRIPEVNKRNESEGGK